MTRNRLSMAIKLTLSGVALGTLVACGGGGGGSTSSSSGSSGTSVGTVSGFGSVYVNGTRFETDGSVESDDGINRETQLEKGMVLQVKGSWDGRGSGRADRLIYDDMLRGPLTGASWDDVERTGSLTLLGQNIAIDGRTVIRGARPDELAATPGNYRVRVSGWRMDEGEFRATYVGARLRGVEFDGANEVEIEGIVRELKEDAETFLLNGFLVNYTSATGDDDFSLSDLRDGLAVEVEGRLQGGVIIASEIEEEDDLFDEDDDVEISGEIYGYDAGASQFRLNGVLVQITSRTEFDDLRRSSLADGLLVEVEGDFRNGVLVAEEIEGRQSDAELEGVIEAIDLSREIITVSGVSVQLTANTLIELDDDDDDSEFNQTRDLDIQTLQTGDFVEVEGRQRESDGGYLEAFNIELEDDDDDEGDDEYELEARLSEVGSDFIRIMNLEIRLNSFSTRDFREGDEVEAEYISVGGGEYWLTEDLED